MRHQGEGEATPTSNPKQAMFLKRFRERLLIGGKIKTDKKVGQINPRCLSWLPDARGIADYDAIYLFSTASGVVSGFLTEYRLF